MKKAIDKTDPQLTRWAKGTIIQQLNMVATGVQYTRYNDTSLNKNKVYECKEKPLLKT